MHYSIFIRRRKNKIKFFHKLCWGFEFLSNHQKFSSSSIFMRRNYFVLSIPFKRTIVVLVVDHENLASNLNAKIAENHCNTQ